MERGLGCWVAFSILVGFEYSCYWVLLVEGFLGFWGVSRRCFRYCVLFSGLFVVVGELGIGFFYSCRRG